MIEWTPAAQEQFVAFMAGNRDRWLAEGADIVEVEADWRAHLEAAVAEEARSVVTGDDVARLLGSAVPPPPPPPPLASAAGELGAAAVAGAGSLDLRLAGRLGPSTPKPQLGPLALVWVALAGILLPLGTLMIEGLTGICAATLFDPIPSLGHGLLVALVPLFNAILWLALWRRSPRRRPLLGLLAGLAGGISLYYAVQFLPFTPLAILGIPVGIGLLPLSPLLAYLAYFTLRGKLRTQARLAGPGVLRTWPGLLAAFVLLAALDLPKVATYVGLSMAGAESPVVADSGIRLLRRAGGRDQLLRLCYQRPGLFTDVVGMLYCAAGGAPTPAQTRQIFYRVFGTAFNALPAPSLRGARGGSRFEWDPEVAGDAVGGRLANLFLTHSRLDASVDADGGVSYSEWTFEFANDGGIQHEARMHLRLPPGGVVSRLTLWVDGEPREAAFASRAEVKTAYQNVVRRRQDPVLVTTSGPQQVLVQCFPVPPNGGTMKIRLGITAPVTPTADAAGRFHLPRLIERNFRTRPGFAHAVWLESPTPFAPPPAALHLENPAAGLHALRGQLDDASFAATPPIAIARTPGLRRAWTSDDRGEPPGWIVQQVASTTAPTPAGLVLVVDGGQAMKTPARRLAAELRGLALACPIWLVLATDAPTLLVDGSSDGQQLAEAVARTTFVGGMDNLPALILARDLATRHGNLPVLWLHGPQPVEMASADTLVQHYERRAASTPILAAQLVPGRNVLANALHQAGALRAAPDDLEPPGGIAILLEQLAGVRPVLAWQRQAVDSRPDHLDDTKQTSDHLARLQAHDTIHALLATGTPADRRRALELAARYQLVTPVSGAVVLETAQQYRAAGLEPVDEQTVPTIPEPETWAMLLVVAAVLLAGCLIRRRSKARPHPA